jgi:hypothetical protein
VGALISFLDSIDLLLLELLIDELLLLELLIDEGLDPDDIEEEEEGIISDLLRFIKVFEPPKRPLDLDLFILTLSLLVLLRSIFGLLSVELLPSTFFCILELLVLIEFLKLTFELSFILLVISFVLVSGWISRPFTASSVYKYVYVYIKIFAYM